MKTFEQVSGDKIRGGFYSPPELVALCVQRVQALVHDRSGLRVLEPSAGDGAFIRGLARSNLSRQVSSLLAIELLESEAAKCLKSLDSAPFSGRVEVGSLIPWSCTTDEMFDVAIGNPPFVRYQFVRSLDTAWLPTLAARLGTPLAGVSNLWIPLLLAALSRLKPYGAFAFIIPTECFTGVSAGTVRDWLSRHVDQLNLDLFPPGSFPDVLQDVLVLSGIRRAEPRALHIQLSVREHQTVGVPRSWTHNIPPGPRNWTRYLLSPTHLDAYEEARDLPAVCPLGQLARFEVAAVTGANEYFSVDTHTADRYHLHRWALPLLPSDAARKGALL